MNSFNCFFSKSFVLDVWLDSEYASDYPKLFSIIINSDCNFESSKNVSEVISILFKYTEKKFFSYVPNLSEIIHEEPGQQNCFGFFFVNSGYAYSCFDYLYVYTKNVNLYLIGTELFWICELLIVNIP